MGSEILKGLEGACRIVVVVFMLLASGLTGCFLIYKFDFPTVNTIMCFLILIGVCIWYFLLLLNVVEYSGQTRKIDAWVHLVGGIILCLTGIIFFGLWLGGSAAASYNAPEMFNRRFSRRSRLFWYLFLFGNILFLLATIVISVLGCILRRCCCAANV